MSHRHANARGHRAPASSHARVGLPVHILLSVLACAAVGRSQPDTSARRVTCANFELAAEWTVEKQMQRTRFLWTVPLWIPGRDAFGYKSGTRDEINYYLVDPVAMSRTEVLDRRELASMLEAELRTSLDWKRLDLANVTIADGGRRLEFDIRGEGFAYDLVLHTLSRVERVQASADEQASCSPDGERSVFVRDCDLFLSRTGQSAESEIRITSDGEENNSATSQVAWSPDSKSFAMVREDWREVGDLWLINPLSDPRPTLETFKWPMPAEPVEQYSLWVYRCDENKLLQIHADRWVDQTILQVQWALDSSQLYFLRLSRDWLSLDLCRADPATGTCEVLVEERDHRQLIQRPPYHLLSTGEILWWSMRDGWGHYYLYDRDGNLAGPVTRGSYHSGDVIRIDEENRALYVMACGREEGRNPYYHHLYRVGLDGTGAQLLTPEDAEHEIYVSGSGRYFVDTYSRADLEPHAVVRDSQGRIVMELDAADIGPLVDAGWRKPEIFRVKAADGKTDMWGVMFKPFDFDPGRKYPVIAYGYPGKETEFIP